MSRLAQDAIPIVVGTTSNRLPDANIAYFESPTQQMTPSPPKNLRSVITFEFSAFQTPILYNAKMRLNEALRWLDIPQYIDRIIDENPVVKIWQIDEFGYPWYEVTLIADDGEAEEHTIMVYDDGTSEKLAN